MRKGGQYGDWMGGIIIYRLYDGEEGEQYVRWGRRIIWRWADYNIISSRIMQVYVCVLAPSNEVEADTLANTLSQMKMESSDDGGMPAETQIMAM